MAVEKESAKKSLPKRTVSQPEDNSSAKKAKVEHPISPPMLPAKPPQIEPPAGANSTELPAKKAKIEKAEQPGDNVHMQRDTPAGANSPTPPQLPQPPASDVAPQLPQSPASDVTRTVIDELEDSQASQCEAAVSQCEAAVSQCEAAAASQCEGAEKLDKRKKNSWFRHNIGWKIQ